MNADTPEIEPDPGDSKSRPEPDLEDGRDPLEALAEEFLDRMRRGERPAVSEFLARAPERAGELEELLSALLLVEDVKLHADATSAAGAGRLAQAAGRSWNGLATSASCASWAVGAWGSSTRPSRNRSTGMSRSKCLRRAQLGPPRSSSDSSARPRPRHSFITPTSCRSSAWASCEGLHYYAMQFIRGLSLDKVLKEVRRLKDRAPADPAEEATATHPVTGGGD